MLLRSLSYGIERSKLATMIYGVSRNKGDGIGYSEEAPLKRMHTLVKSKEPHCYCV